MGSLRCWLAVLCACVFWVGNPSRLDAQEAPKERASIIGNLERYTLSNGLRIVLNPVPEATTVGVCVTYDVGSRDEQEGRTGIAHLFEHLMFQGSLNVAAGDHFGLVAARGGHANGEATKESTDYFTEIPSGELELVLWLEADRMFRLGLSRQSFEAQRAVILEELRQRHARDPFARGEVRLHELVFQRYWPYEHPALGYRRDVESADYAWVRQFQERHYTPEGAVLAIAGGFDPSVARAWIEKYFGESSPDADVESPQAGGSTLRLPRQTSERLSVLEEAAVKAPGVFFGWRIPGARAEDHYALQLASLILSGSETSRLHEQLVLGDQLAQTVRSQTAGYSDADVFQIFVELNRRSTVDAMQKSLEKALRGLAGAGPSELELQRARARLEVQWLQRLERARSRALSLARTESTFGNAALLADEYAAYGAVTAARVRDAVARYLVDTRRSIVEVYPPGWVRDIGPPIVTATYIVKPGDNLTRIAQWHGTTPEAIAKQNGFGTSRRIVVGQRLLITANPAKIVKPVVHTVAKGETLSGIGKRYGVDAADIAKRNGLNTKKAIRPGQVLQIPPRAKPDKTNPKATPEKNSPSAPADKNKAGATTSTTPSAKPESRGKSASHDAASPKDAAPPPPKTYVVKPGDSLSVIAARHKVSVAALTRANGISKKKPIRPGQRLVIPSTK